MGELKALGTRQIMVCSAFSKMESYCQREGFDVAAFPRKSSVSFSFTRSLAHLQNSFKPDVIHVHGSHAHTFAVLAATLFGCSSPVVVSRRVDFPISKSWFSRYKYNHRKVKKIICVSRAIEEITARGLKNPSLLTTIHSGVDTSRFHPEQRGNHLREEFSIPSDVALVGNVAALAPHKDYFTFVDAVKLLVENGPQARYFIIGAGPLEQEIRSYVSKQGLENHIVFTGFRKDIATILPELDLFLITSKTEGLGTSILDALACKVPVVATNAGGIPEIILHQQTGWLGEVQNPGSLADGVRQVLSDSQLRTKLVAGGSQHLLQFDKAETARQTLAVYHSVTAS